MTLCGDFFLRHQHSIAHGAVLACCQTGFGTGRSLCGVHDLGVTLDGDFFLRRQHGIAHGTMLALGQTSLGTGRSLCSVHDLGMTFCGDFFLYRQHGIADRAVLAFGQTGLGASGSLCGVHLDGMVLGVAGNALEFKCGPLDIRVTAAQVAFPDERRNLRTFIADELDGAPAVADGIEYVAVVVFQPVEAHIGVGESDRGQGRVVFKEEGGDIGAVHHGGFQGAAAMKHVSAGAAGIRHHVICDVDARQSGALIKAVLTRLDAAGAEVYRCQCCVPGEAFGLIGDRAGRCTDGLHSDVGRAEVDAFQLRALGEAAIFQRIGIGLIAKVQMLDAAAVKRLLLDGQVVFGETDGAQRGLVLESAVTDQIDPIADIQEGRRSDITHSFCYLPGILPAISGSNAQAVFIAGHNGASDLVRLGFVNRRRI